MIQKTIPLLHDHHTHPLFYAAFQNAIDFSSVRSIDVARDLIAARALDTDAIVLGHSWKDNLFSFETDVLEKLPACAIFNLSLHSLAINSAAIVALKKRIGTQIECLTDRDWYERNLRTVLNWFSLSTGSAESLKVFFDHLETLGVWSAEEMLLVDGVEIDWFDESGLSDRTRFWSDPETFESLSQNHKERVYGFKLFTDGAFGARTAAISEAYLGEANNYGMLIYSDDELFSKIQKLVGHDLALAVHAIGDRAIEQTLSAVESVRADGFKEVRIEHAQVISVEQAKRAKRSGVVLSMQPNFNTDSVDYRDRLPAKFVERNNPFRMLIDEVGFEPGVDLVFGSDGMPHGIQNAVNAVLDPAFDSQRLAIDELIAGSKCAENSGLEFEIEF